MQEKRQKKNIGEIIDKKYFTKGELQDHDRELVKEVCEKIARNVRVRKIKKEWYAIETDLRAVLDQIQSEVGNE